MPFDVFTSHCSTQRSRWVVTKKFLYQPKRTKLLLGLSAANSEPSFECLTPRVIPKSFTKGFFQTIASEHLLRNCTKC